MSTPLIRRPESNGAIQTASPRLTEYVLPATGRGMSAQLSAVFGLLIGVWVALSPWFITLQNGGTNANTVNLISGLAVAGVSVSALASPRAFASLQAGGALLGVWLIIAGPILSQKHSIADPMFWSNSWAGGALIALAAIAVASVALRGPVRR